MIFIVNLYDFGLFASLFGHLLVHLFPPFQVKDFFLLKSVQKQRNYALIKNAKIVCINGHTDVHLLTIELLRFPQGT